MNGCDIWDDDRLWLQDVTSYIYIYMYWLTKTCHVSDAIHGFDAWHGTRMTRGFAFRPGVLRSHKLSKRLAKRCAAGSPASRNGRSKISPLHFITRWLSSRPCSSHRCLHRSFYANVSTISQRLLSQICGPQRMLSESEGFSIWRVLSNDWRQQKMWKHNRNPNQWNRCDVKYWRHPASTSIWEDRLIWPTFISLLVESKRLYAEILVGL